MAPEQVEPAGAEIEPTIDVHALGVIAYWLVSGRHPFQASRLSETVELILNHTPDPLSHVVQEIPAWYETFCQKCLAKKPRQRFVDANVAADFLSTRLKRTSAPVRISNTASISQMSQAAPQKLFRTSWILPVFLAGALVLLTCVVAFKIGNHFFS